jgi:hypothetical protein
MIALLGHMNSRPNVECTGVDDEAIRLMRSALVAPSVSGASMFRLADIVARAILSLCLSEAGVVVGDMRGFVDPKHSWTALLSLSANHKSKLLNWRAHDNCILMCFVCCPTSPGRMFVQNRQDVLQIRMSNGRLLCDLTRSHYREGVVTCQQSVFSVHLPLLESALEWEGMDYALTSSLGL